MLGHGDGGHFDGGDAAQGECEVADVWEFRNELDAETDDTEYLFDLDPDRDGDVEPVVHADKELDEEVDVLRAGRRVLAGEC